MCGIIGYTGSEPVTPILIDGLKRLEYRGYDSAGIAVNNGGKINIAKKMGYVVKLEEEVKSRGGMEGFVGIGHTRWATHGKPSDENSHPHTGMQGKIAVVHNGIIENYQKIKDELIAKGIKFSSQTDTEVMAQLIEYYYEGDLFDAVVKALRRVEGSYALGIMSADEPDKIIAVRKNNPLIIGLGEDGNYIASDIPALLQHTRRIYRLGDMEIAVLEKDCVKVYDMDKNPIAKQEFIVDWDISAAEKGGYEHFMLKEIMEQPKVFGDTINPRIKNGQVALDDISFSEEYVKGLERIYIIACGTAYHVGLAGKYTYERLLGIQTEACLASEFRYADPVLNEKTLVIIVSQSGMTADTLEALRESKRGGARTLGIVNVVGSMIADEVDDVLYTWAGPEIAVASTKAYSTQLAAMYLIGLYLAKKKSSIDDALYNELIEQLQSIPGKMERIIDNIDNIKEIAGKYYKANDIFFIGRGLDYAVAMEASLKLKEISYIHSEAYASGELKHGTISLIEEGTPVISIAATSRLFDKQMSNAEEVRSRGASLIALVGEDKVKELKKVDSLMVIPQTHELLTPCLSVLPMQLFAYYMALNRGCNIDKPKNLAKSVTVE